MNTPERIQTFQTYEDSAQELAQYFAGIGPRIDDIEKAIEICPNPDNPKVVELGCGDGRDATAILKRSGWYLGIDTSSKLIEIAGKKLGSENFEVADISQFHFPPDLDVVFAFASLLHLDLDEVQGTLESAYEALKPGGICFVSLKHASEFTHELKTDKYGSRQFFYYNPDITAELEPRFDEVYRDFQIIGDTKWFTQALKKSID